MSARESTYQLNFAFASVDLPNKGFVVSSLRDARMPIAIDGREDVERGKNTGNSERQHPKC